MYQIYNTNIIRFSYANREGTSVMRESYPNYRNYLITIAFDITAFSLKSFILQYSSGLKHLFNISSF
jgi:hypothetical protein